ncbi:MAG: hypothetical protein ACRDR6_22980 [Pseudonocardiaceae bacterium]
MTTVDPVEGRIHMHILRIFPIVFSAVAPLAFAIPAGASDEPTYTGEPTYTCNTVLAPAVPARAVFGEGDCLVTNGALASGFITTERFLIMARTGDKLEFRCRGGGHADAPTSVTADYCS